MLAHADLGGAVLGYGDDERRCNLICASTPGRRAILAPQCMAYLVAQRRQHLVGTIALVQDDQGVAIAVLPKPRRPKILELNVDPQIGAVPK